MSKIKYGGLDQYDAKPFEQRQFGTAGIEGVNDELTDETFVLLVSGSNETGSLTNRDHSLCQENFAQFCGVGFTRQIALN